jgi:transposase
LVGTSKYSPEFRREVVAYALDAEHTIAQTARDFGLVENTVGNWVNAEKKRRSEGSGNTGEARDAAARASEAAKDREIQRLKAENAFLKKAAAFFARQQP